MLTPATSASRTSAPPVIIENAFSTQVCAPPFLNLWPLLDAITSVLTPFVITAGAWPNTVFGIAAAAIPATVVFTNFRRFGLFIGFRLLFLHWRRGPTPAAFFAD